MKAAVVPTVFIIDDDRGMRQAVQDLVESVGLRADDPSCLVGPYG